MDELSHFAFIAFAFALLSISAFALGEGAKALAQVDANSTIWQQWLDAYSKVSEMSRAGMNVSSYVFYLQQSLSLMQNGDLEKARALLESVIPQIDASYQQLGSFIFWKNAEKYLTVALIALIPVLFYIYFPRAYLSIWYRARRKWVIEE